MHYAVTITVSQPFGVDTDLLPHEIEERIEAALEQYGFDGWPQPYARWLREEWEKHPRKYASQLRDAPPADMDVDDGIDIATFDIDVEAQP